MERIKNRLIEEMQQMAEAELELLKQCRTYEEAEIIALEFEEHQVQKTIGGEEYDDDKG